MSPDGSTKPPPEEKLLKLIRGQGGAPAAGASGAPQGGTGGLAADGPARGWRLRRFEWFKPTVICLTLVLGIELVWLIAQASRPLPEVRVPAASLPPEEPPAAAPAPLELPSLAASASRSLFAPSGAAAGAAAPQQPPSGLAKQLASRLTLMGIIPGNPAQAIIEDSQTKKTYFVTTGQAVLEGAVLEQVLDNHVVLDLLGEKIELTL